MSVCRFLHQPRPRHTDDRHLQSKRRTFNALLMASGTVTWPQLQLYRYQREWVATSSNLGAVLPGGEFHRSIPVRDLICALPHAPCITLKQSL